MTTVAIFNLSKDAPTFNLSKAVAEAQKAQPTKLLVGAGWSTPEGQAKIDLDLTVAALNADGKFVGNPDASFAFYNNRGALAGVELSEDCRDGETSDGDDDETAMITIASLPEGTAKLVISLSVHDDDAGRTLSAAESAYVRVADAETGEEFVRLSTSELNHDASDMISITLGDEIIVEENVRGISGDLNTLVAAFV